MSPLSTRTHPTIRRIGLVTIAALALAACGGDADGGAFGDLGDLTEDPDTANEADAAEEEFAEAMNEAMGAGGGGTLTFDGTEHPIESVVCSNDDTRVDIGTVGGDFRVFVSGDPDDLNLQILGPDAQWFDGDKQQNNKSVVTVEGNTYTASSTTWWNNSDDRVIEAGFTIECP